MNLSVIEKAKKNALIYMSKKPEKERLGWIGFNHK